MSNNIVIVGGGVAAISAIKAIREIQSETKISVFQNEKIYPYYRIKLTKSLFDNLEEDKILLQKKEWYESNNVNLYLGKEVVALDTVNQNITINDGSNFHYDKLLLAHGASNFIPPIDGINKRNIFTIRNYSNVQDIRNNLNDKKTILNIGGGIQGLEAVWAFSKQNKKVTIIEVADRLMPRQLDTRASEILKKIIENLNIKVLLNMQIEKIVGEDEVKGIVTKNGDAIDCDMIIYSIGIRPNKKLLENTNIKTNIGVIVNDRMQTNIENVYAAGDISEFDGRIGGLWSIAMEQGKVAGYNIENKESFYSSAVPVTTMNAFNISLFSMGNIDENKSTKTLIEESSDGLSYKRIFIKDNKIVGAIIVGDIKHSTILKNAIEKEIVIDKLDLDAISIDNLLIELKNK